MRTLAKILITMILELFCKNLIPPDQNTESKLFSKNSKNEATFPFELLFFWNDKITFKNSLKNCHSEQ